MRIARYERQGQAAWDDFVRASRNGTFLFERGYMDYHADRFADHSLFIHDDRGGLAALLPANESGEAFSSHGGLTYGGFVVGARMTTPAMLECFDAVIAYLRGGGFKTLRYKPIPHIYHAYPTEEDRFALAQHGSRVYRSDVVCAALPSRPLPYQERRVRKMKQAAKAGVEARPSDEWSAFWPILAENLRQSHDAAPVHSLEEITLLAHRFPDNIRLHAALEGDRVIAGVVVFDTGRVAKAQYIGSSERAREIGALDLLFATLLEREYAARAYFDFGSSNGTDGKLNVGLIEQKEGFGARAVVQEFHEVAIA
jgi:hypothetical protein